MSSIDDIGLFLILFFPLVSLFVCTYIARFELDGLCGVCYGCLLIFAFAYHLFGPSHGS